MTVDLSEIKKATKRIFPSDQLGKISSDKVGKKNKKLPMELEVLEPQPRQVCH